MSHPCLETKGRVLEAERTARTKALGRNKFDVLKKKKTSFAGTW